jgi:antitoxin HicB
LKSIDFVRNSGVSWAVIESFRKSGLTKTEFARRIGKAEGKARRILDPDHPTKLGAMQAALRALGKTLVISVGEAA